MKKVYIIKKIVVANSLREAIAKEKDTPVDECYQSNESATAHINNLISGGRYEKSMIDDKDEE